MNTTGNKMIGFTILIISLILSACGPSPEEQAATAAVLTAAAATSTPLPTSTPAPTFTPTPTQTPTPTPTPVPDAGTMIDREELALPSSYQVNSPDMWGIQKGAFAYRAPNKTYYIENSFVFGDIEREELVFGYTVDLSGKSDIEVIDDMLSDYWDGAEEGYSTAGRTILGSSQLPGAENIGDKSSGFRVEYMAGTTHILLEQVGFRIGDIYAIAVVKNFQGADPFISAIDVARVYASSIQNPIFSCQLKNVTPVEGAAWPSYDYQAEGFYPGESLIVMIEGKVILNNEPLLVGYADGLGDEFAVNRVVGEKILSRDFEIFSFNLYSVKADNEGRADGTIMLTALEGPDVVHPKDYTLSVYGLYSGCEISVKASYMTATDPVGPSILIFSDDFEDELQPGWEWLYESKDRWTLHEKPGFLHFEVALDTKQFLARNAPEGNFEITTRVLITPHQNFQFAGLFILQDDGHKLMFGRGFAYFPDAECCIGNALYYDNQDKILGVPEQGYAINLLSPTKTDELDEAYLRLTREGKTYTAYYSNDGENWTTIGKHKVGWVPVYVGIMARGNQNSTSVDADFDFFTLKILP